MRRLIIAAAVAASLAGCATTRSLSAAGDVRALLIAIRDDDRQAFEAHVDRRALRANLQARIVARSKAMGHGGASSWLGVLLSGPAAKAADQLLVRPEVFRGVADYYGYKPGTPIPGAIALSTVLKPQSDGTVCAVGGRPARCVATFAHEGEAWRLVDISPPPGSMPRGFH